MENKNKKKKSPLDSFKLRLEKDSYPKRYASPTAGNRLLSSRLKRVVTRIKNFFRDIIEAIRELIKEVM